MVSRPLARATIRYSLPLCSRYFVVFFESLSVQLRDQRTKSNLFIHWARGFLADGGHEVLGAWPEATAGVTPWQDILDDLETRGVEKIQFVATPGQTEVPGGLFGATTVPSLASALRQDLSRVAPRDRQAITDGVRAIREAPTFDAALDATDLLLSGPLGMNYPAMQERWRAETAALAPLHALAPRDRQLFLAAEDTTQQIHASLSRSVGARGGFADSEHALSFVAIALQRSERKVSAGRWTSPLSPRRALHTATSAGIAAFVL